MKLEGRVRAILEAINVAFKAKNAQEARRLFRYLYEVAPIFRVLVDVQGRCDNPECPVHGPIQELEAEEAKAGRPPGVNTFDLLKVEVSFGEFMELLPAFSQGLGKPITSKQIYRLLEYLLLNMEKYQEANKQIGGDHPAYNYLSKFVAEGVIADWSTRKQKTDTRIQAVKKALANLNPVKQLTEGKSDGPSVDNPLGMRIDVTGNPNEEGDKETMSKVEMDTELEEFLAVEAAQATARELDAADDGDGEEEEERETKHNKRTKENMAQEKHTSKTVVADVKHEGMTIIVPKAMTKREAIVSLMRQMKYEEEQVSITETIKGFPLDAAYALSLAVQELYGWLVGEPTPPESFFDSWKPPQLVAVEVAPGKTKQVLWGSFSIPSIDGTFKTKITAKDQHLVLDLIATVKRKHEKDVELLAQTARRILHERSIFRGKAFKLRFVEDKENDLNMPEPKFMDLSGVMEEELIYSDHVLRAIRTNLFTPIERTEDCRKFGIPTKRGVLLAGDYGTGKTLAAHIVAKKSEANGWTFILCQNANDLASTVDFAAQYQPAVVFCEDVDQVVAGNRSVDMNNILNVVDGIESKNQSIMVVFTTNEVEEIHGAMLRPGRLDAVIHVERPDAATVERLLRHYGRGLIPEQEDLTLVSERLAGSTPAIIRECVERSKLSAVALSSPGVNTLTITAAALEDSEITMKMHRELLEKASEEGDEHEFAREALHILGEHLEEAVEGIADKLQETRLAAANRS